MYPLKRYICSTRTYRFRSSPLEEAAHAASSWVVAYALKPKALSLKPKPVGGSSPRGEFVGCRKSLGVCAVEAVNTVYCPR